MKIHYFCMMAGTACIIPLLPVYAITSLHFSYSGLGFVYAILPLVGLFAKTLSGSLTNLFQCHRGTLLASIAVTALTLFSIFFLEPIPLDGTSNIAKVTFDCSQFSYLRYNLPSKACEIFDKPKVTEFSTCKIVCNGLPETVEYMCQSWNIDPNDCREDYLNFSASVDLSGFDKEKNAAFFPVKNLSFLTSQVEDPHCSQLIHVGCIVRCDNADLMSYFGAPLYAPPYSYAGLMQHYQFWLFLGFMVVAYSGYSIAIGITDKICFKVIADVSHKYGKQRMWGSIGWGTSIIVTGLLIDATSASTSEANYTSMFFLAFIIMAVDFILTSRIKVNVRERTALDGKMVSKALSSWRSALFALCCIIIGLSTGMLFTYLLILAEKVAHKWDCSFEHTKLLQGLIVAVQCVCGELTFYFISGAIIKRLGHVHAMSLAILAFGVRFILYFFVRNPWMFLPLELFSVFTFGVFCSVITSYARVISPPGAQATVEFIFGAAFAGLGTAIGAFVGAALINAASEAHAFLYIGIFNIVFAIFHVSVQFISGNGNSLTLGRPSVIGYISPGDSSAEQLVD